MFRKSAKSAPVTPSAYEGRSRANSVSRLEAGYPDDDHPQDNPISLPAAPPLPTGPSVRPKEPVQATNPIQKKKDPMKSTVYNVLEIKDLLDSNKTIEGKKVWSLLNEVSDRLMEKHLEEMNKQKEEMQKEALDRQDELERKMTYMIQQMRSETREDLDNTTHGMRAELRQVSQDKEDLHNTTDRLSQMLTRADPCTPYKCGRARIPVPVNLADTATVKRDPLERFWKLDRVFKNVPTFTDNGNPTIRDFLNAVVSVTATVPPSYGLTKEEYFQVLWGKLGATVQSELMGMSQLETGNPDQLHTALLMNYDNSETGDEAFRKLQELKPTAELNSISRYLREAKRLKELTAGSEPEQARCFITSLRNFLPYRLKKRLEDKLLENVTITNKTVPDWSFLASFANVHRDEIEEFIAKMLTNPHVYKTNYEDDDGDEYEEDEPSDLDDFEEGDEYEEDEPSDLDDFQDVESSEDDNYPGDEDYC